MSRDTHFERFESHTRLKHFLLTAYLKKWANILAGRYARLWFIDAFAGCGRDATGIDGSPVIASAVAREIAATRFRAPLGTPLPANQGMQVVAVEADEGRARQLFANLETFRTQEPRVAHAHHGTMQDFLPVLQPRIQGDPILYFLDPFGVGGLDASVLKQLFDGPRREVLLLFSDVAAVRLAGQVGTEVPDREVLLAERERPLSLFGAAADAEDEQATHVAVERALAGHRSNAKARAILTRAFGSDEWETVVANAPVTRRRAVLLDLYCEVLRNSGATHVLRFQVQTDDGKHKYTLLHASQHRTAFAAMKEAMHSARRTIPRAAEQPVLASLFEAPNSDPVAAARTDPSIESVASDEAVQINDAVDQIARHFAGQSAVRWSDDPVGREGVRSFALHSTPLLMHQFDDLKSALRRRGYLTCPRPATYAFPAQGTDALANAS